MRKLQNLEFRDPVKVDDAPHETPDLLIVGVGSTGGTIDEARKRLEADGITSNHVTIRLIHPFPTEQLKPYFEKAKTVAVVENNATGQLADQIKLHLGGAEKIRNILKYDGTPFLPSEIYKHCKELV